VMERDFEMKSVINRDVVFPQEIYLADRREKASQESGDCQRRRVSIPLGVERDSFARISRTASVPTLGNGQGYGNLIPIAGLEHRGGATPVDEGDSGRSQCEGGEPKQPANEGNSWLPENLRIAFFTWVFVEVLMGSVADAVKDRIRIVAAGFWRSLIRRHLTLLARRL